MNNDNVNKKEILSIILKFNLIIGIYNLYLFSISQSVFNLVVGSMNIDLAPKVVEGNQTVLLPTI